MRQSWTDERMDDLSGYVRDGFKRLDTDLRAQRLESRTDTAEFRSEMKDEFAELRTEMKDEFAKVGDRLDSIQRMMIGFSSALIVSLIALAVTQ